MDFATIAGLIMGAGLILVSIALGTGLRTFIDVPSMLVVVGGTLAATLISFKGKQVIGLAKLVKQTLLQKKLDLIATTKQFVEFATVARKDGVLALEAQLDELGCPFFKKGLSLVVDGAAEDVVRGVLEADVMAFDERHQHGAKLVDSMANAAPAWGMIGTLMGLVQMLNNLDDPSKIGGGMAVALLTTFYGAVIANLVCGPLASKLATKHKEELQHRQVVLEGVLALRAGDNPRIIEDKLLAFLPPVKRAQVRADRAQDNKG